MRRCVFVCSLAIFNFYNIITTCQQSRDTGKMEDKTTTDSCPNSSSEWRKSSFMDKLKHVLTHSIMADLTIRLINGVDIKEYNVHSIFFVMASEVFEKMLQSSFKEGLTKTIEMKDVKPEIFDLLLNHLYGQPLNISNLDHITDLTELANYYMMDGLKTEIINYCESNKTTRIACIGLEVAEICDAPSLKESKLQYITRNTLPVVSHESFLKASVETIQTVLDRDNLNIKEIDLFKALEKWIKHNITGTDESLKQILIRKVRYFSMTPKEFVSGVVASDLLRPEDITSLLSHLVDENCLTPLPEGFTKVKRSDWHTYQLHFSTFTCNKGINYLDFQVSKKILLTHFIIYTLITDVEYEEVISIHYYNSTYHSWKEVAIFEGKVNGSDNIKVKLNEPLQLEAGTTHSVYIVTTKGDRKCVKLPKKLMISQDVTFSFEETTTNCSLHSILFEL